MLHILGSRTRLCDGITRREALRAGGLGLLGLTLPHLTRGEQARAAGAAKQAAGFGKAKRCILLYLYGSPSQLETFDLKPEAPTDSRSQFKPIKTAVPGVDICEHLPRTSAVMDKVTLIRSMTSPYNIHNVAYVLSGLPKTDIPMELNPRDSRHWPYFGSVLDFLDAQKGRRSRDIPLHVGLPWKFSSRSEPFRRGGPFGGFLGAGYDPVWAEFHGTATKPDPYGGIEAKMRFEVTPPGAASLTLDRLDKRRSLLEQFDRSRKNLKSAEPSFDRYRGMAMDLVSSAKVRTALDVSREPRALRESYGMMLFGQSCLAARRLVEAGSRFVSVFWDEYGLAGSAWDTHWEHYPRMKNELCPGFDQGFAGLIRDLDSRGMLDDTLVVCVSEHGRTPKLTYGNGGGRDHWSRAYSAVLAGGGIGRGRQVGKTDRIASDVVERPISPKDILATTYHLLGIDPETLLEDRLGRPMPLVPGAHVITEALA